ncbi:MAG: FAD-binding protein, partial [Eubacterium sp.]|nr:FAD-binding protein [Eubacterium sp.]
MEHIIIKSDVLIIGGGTAGCYAAVRLAELSDLHVVIAEKANIERSGCLAAGVNALNAYISEGYTPMDYVRYASRDAGGIVREDLLLDISVRLNAVTHDLERKGLTILKDADGNYVTRGWRNL